jgi:hypothetical protein
MKLYRFSPIQTQEELFEAIKHTHFMCFELCRKALGKHPPVAGNIGIFCHYDQEYQFLTKLREELTDVSDNWNNKYFRLHNPIVIEAKGDVPEISYTYLYIRRPDPHRAQVGDVDFVLGAEEYDKLKQSILTGSQVSSARILDRPDLNMIELSDPDIDALAYLGTKTMSENLGVKLTNL